MSYGCFCLEPAVHLLSLVRLVSEMHAESKHCIINMLSVLWLSKFPYQEFAHGPQWNITVHAVA